MVLMPWGFTLERTVEEFTQMKFPACGKRLGVFQSPGSADRRGSQDSGRGHPPRGLSAHNPGATRDSLVRREGWDRLTAVKSGRVWELPARMVKRPGPGVLEGLERLAEILAP
jgi:hypothetical protein